MCCRMRLGTFDGFNTTSERRLCHTFAVFTLVSSTTDAGYVAIFDIRPTEPCTYTLPYCTEGSRSCSLSGPEILK
jgi:hypothetical protein